jgi:hypothetical protein
VCEHRIYRCKTEIAVVDRMEAWLCFLFHDIELYEKQVDRPKLFKEDASRNDR